jgi:methionyl-tRNA formyltransferase
MRIALVGQQAFGARVLEAFLARGDEAADEVVSGRHREVAQNELAASYEGWCRDAEAEINWHCHVDQVYSLIRGCNPSPGAWTAVQGGRHTPKP